MTRAVAMYEALRHAVGFVVDDWEGAQSDLTALIAYGDGLPGHTRSFVESSYSITMTSEATAGVVVDVSPVFAEGELQRVYAVGQRIGLRQGEPVTLLTVERWRRGVHLTYVASFTLPPRSERQVPGIASVWRLGDDVGTSYAEDQGQGASTRDRFRGFIEFGPGIPDAATQLTVEVVEADRVTARAEVPLG
jgi:hypothetical protein